MDSSRLRKPLIGVLVALYTSAKSKPTTAAFVYTPVTMLHTLEGKGLRAV